MFSFLEMHPNVCRKLDLRHDFVSQVQRDARKVLCVIVGSAELASEGSITTTTSITGGENVQPVCSTISREGVSGKYIYIYTYLSLFTVAL